jgi:predicted nucleotidyltransferase
MRTSGSIEPAWYNMDMLQTVIRRPKTAQDIAAGVRLTRMNGDQITPAAVARVLRKAGVKYVLVGAHAANGYTGRPRNTIDVDVVVQFPKKAAKAIAAAFPKLRIHDTPVVTRFMNGDVEAIDLMKPIGSTLWLRLLKDAREISLEGETVRIPSLEGVLAAKFAAMASAHRRVLDKQQDAVDFGRIIQANQQIDLSLLAELGELVYSGGGESVRKLAEDARAGRRLEF